LPDDNLCYQIMAIPPGGSYYGLVDGITTSKYNNFVFKIPEGGSVYVCEDGSVDLNYHGFGPIIEAFGFGGWKDRSYFNWWDLNKNGWGDLFNSLETFNH